MEVEILYLSGCPNVFETVSRVRKALRDEGISARIVEVEVAQGAQVAGFLGSPTVRINGRDIERSDGGLETTGLACRMYCDQGEPRGLPPLERIRAAAREARKHDESQ